jgi:hypothetical protein
MRKEIPMRPYDGDDEEERRYIVPGERVFPKPSRI